MATLTAGNFYWTGYKPAGQDPLYRYVRGNRSFGTALSLQGGAGGCTGYSWNEAGNWVVQTAGFTNDPENPGGFIEGFYYEDAPRTPRTGDNVFFTSLTPDDPGINGYYPASECLFGGITGATDAGGGTWQTGTGFGSGDLTGNLNKIFVENDYSSFRGASFQFGNVFGSTFGQQFLGNSAETTIRGLTALLGSSASVNMILTNSDGTTVEFIGNTFLNYIHGGSGTTANNAAISAGISLQANQFQIGTQAVVNYGMTHATEGVYRSLVTGVSSGLLKMTLPAFVAGATQFGITQDIPGTVGNTKITGSGIVGLGGSGISAGNSAAFANGTDNPTEQPKLVLKTESLTVRGDSNINLNDTTINKQSFVLSACQFNYKGGSINQAIFDRDHIDYLGTPQTSASLLDTEVVNSVVISGGGLQERTEVTTVESVDDDGEEVTSLGSVTDRDVSATRPVTYIRPTNTIPTVEIDAFRHGNVIIEGAATTLNMKPEFPHRNGEVSQGKVFISKPLNDSDRMTYSTINLKSYNDAENIAGSKENNLLVLNAGLTVSDLDIGAGTVSVGANIGDRPITVVKGEMSELAVLKARSETNPSYQGFKIGDDFTGLTSNAEGILISHPAADIQFSTGHYVLASFADGNTGADTGFQRPGGAIPAPPPPKGA
jgi:hypothetical protein